MIRRQLMFAAVLLASGCATTATCPPLAMLDGVITAHGAQGVKGAERDWTGLAITRGEARLVPSEHLPLLRGDVLSTGPDTVAIVSFAGARVVLRPNTQVKLGSLLADFGEFLVSGWLKLVQTKTVSAKSHGTKYQVKVDKLTERTTVTVLEGQVTLSPTQERLGQISLQAGQRVAVEKVESAPPRASSVPKEELNALNAQLAQLDKPRDILPDVVGLALNAAVLKLAEHGLQPPDDVVIKKRPGRLGRPGRPGTEQVGHVIDQLPVAGAYSNTVTLTVVEEAVLVPNVVGKGRGDAERALQASGLALGHLDDSYAQDVRTAVVVAQAPLAGELVVKDEAIALTLASIASAQAPLTPNAREAAEQADDRTPVPDVTGVTPERALLAIKNAGFFAQIALTNRSDIDEPRVLSQDPLPNRSWSLAQPIRIWVAAVVPAVTPVVMPAVVKESSQGAGTAK